jgi:hypothetical protein
MGKDFNTYVYCNSVTNLISFYWNSTCMVGEHMDTADFFLSNVIKVVYFL